MKNLLAAAGFEYDQQQQFLVGHLFLSGAFGIDFSNCAEVVESFSEGEGFLDNQKSLLNNLAGQSIEDGHVNPAKLLDSLSRDEISKKYLLATILAGYQRHFISEPVVQFLVSTKYCKDNVAKINELTSALGMHREERINLVEGSESNKQIAVGLTIGATVLTAQDYLERQSRIIENRPNKLDPYEIFILNGSRKLIKDS